MTNEKQKKGTLFIISAPSGAGKTTLITEVIKRLKPEINISQIITYTTRSPRKNEKKSKDYIFITEDDFEKKKTEGFFLETNRYNNHSYGSPASILMDVALGKNLVIIPDINGAKSIAKQVPDAILIWINTKDLTELKCRLLKRGQHTNSELEKRLKIAEQEIKEASKPRLFNYIVINDVFDQTVAEIIHIIKTHSH
jgi:guanylate kinase